MYIVFSYEISVYVFLIREYSTDRPLSEQQKRFPHVKTSVRLPGQCLTQQKLNGINFSLESFA